jgi:hypothetical protein
MPFASWDTARACLRKILEDAAAEKTEGPGMVPLSNVKRAFRTTFQLELSETMLGHSKLSELLQDSRFADICYVHLDGHGYTVIQADGSRYSTPSPAPRVYESLIDDSLEPRKLAFCPDEPLCIDDACEPTLNQPLFGPTPGPFGPTPTASPYPMSLAGTLARPLSAQHDPMFLAQFLSATRVAESLDQSFASSAESADNQFCVDEPLCLDDAVPEVPDMLTFGQTPYPWGPSPTLPLPPLLEQPTLPPLVAYDWASFPLPYHGLLGSMVHNTFIHAAPAPPTPVPSMARRCMSVPLDVEMAASGSTTARSYSSEEEEEEVLPPLKLSLADHLAIAAR